MFKIGEFARLAQVSVRLLHYYEQLGLLLPATVDQSSGYRYYSQAQLPRLHRILALKDLGLTLEQITTLINEAITVEEMRGIWLLKRAELAQRVQEEQLRLARVEARLTHIEQTSDLPEIDVVVKKIDPLHVVSLRQSLLPPDTPLVIFKRMNAMLREQGINNCNRLPLNLYHSRFIWQQHPLLPMHRWLSEAAYLFDEEECGKIAPHPRLRVRTLPGYAQTATVVHCGSDAMRYLAHQAMFRWMETHGYHLAGPQREIYLWRAQIPNSDEHVTEIQFPLEKIDDMKGSNPT